MLGFLCYTTNCGRMQILWIGVKREFHKKGIGTKLLEWLEKEARKYGLYAIEVETLSDK
ncbi:MAG: GNAT family N-acetyltransferase [Candidatus Pacearchaeota archaeon]